MSVECKGFALKMVSNICLCLF